MITLHPKLYVHTTGMMLVITDSDQLPRAQALGAHVLLIADNHLATKRVFKHWLRTHELDEISQCLSISRSSAHRLRAALGITKRGPYDK